MDNQNQPNQKQAITADQPTTEPSSPTQIENASSNAPLSQPAKPLSRNKKKWIIIGAIILVVLLTGSTYVLSQQKSQKPATKSVAQPTISLNTPTPDPTANWKTYKNEKVGYSIKYPPNYSLPDGQGERFSIMSPLNANRGGNFELQNGELKIEIYTEPSPLNDSLEKIALEQTKNLEEANTEINDQNNIKLIKEIKIITINGNKALHRTSSHPLFSPDLYTFIHNQKRVYIAKYPLVTSRQNEFDQILSTLRFTKLSPSASTRDPKPACEQSGGKWLAQYNECEAASGGLDEKTCKELGGVHNACDSACRHDPNAQGCIEVCINVCKF